MLVFFTKWSVMELLVRSLVFFLLFSVIEGVPRRNYTSFLVCSWSLLFFVLGLHFSYYTPMTFLILSVILLFMLMILLSTLSVIGHLTWWQQLELAFELETDLRDAVNWGRKWLVDFSAGKIWLVLFDCSNVTGAIDVKMDGSVFDQKLSFKILALIFTSKLDWGSYIISIAKTASKKIGTLIRSMIFLFLEVALYLGIVG